MTAAPDTRVPPLAPGTLCMLDGQRVVAYHDIWPGQHGPVRYKVVLPGNRRWVYATREQLEVIQ